MCIQIQWDALLTNEEDFDALWAVNGSSEIPLHSTAWPLKHLVSTNCMQGQYNFNAISILLRLHFSYPITWQHTKIVLIPWKSSLFISHWLVSSKAEMRISDSEITFSTKFYKSNCNFKNHILIAVLLEQKFLFWNIYYRTNGSNAY